VWEGSTLFVECECQTQDQGEIDCRFQLGAGLARDEDIRDGMSVTSEFVAFDTKETGYGIGPGARLDDTEVVNNTA